MSEHLETIMEISGTEGVAQALAYHMQLVKQTGQAHEELAETMRNLRAPIWSMRRDLMGIRTAWRMHHAALIEGMRAFRQINYIGRQIVSMWQAYNIAMIRIERAERDVEDASKDLADAQRIYLQYLRDFGAESPLTQEAFRNLQDAIKDYEDALRRADKARQDMIAGWIGIGFQAAGLISNIVDIVYHFQLLRTIMASKVATEGIVGASTAAAGSLKAIGYTIATALLPKLALAGAALGGFIWLMNQIRPVGRSVEENIIDQAHALIAWGGSIKQSIRNLRELGWTQEEIRKYYMEISRLVYMSRSEFEMEMLILGYTNEQMEEMWKNLQKIREEIGYTTFELQELGEVAYGGSVFPELTRWSRKAASEIAKIGVETEKTAARIRNVNITNYFGGINAEVDLERAGYTIYRRLMRELERIW